VRPQVHLVGQVKTWCAPSRADGRWRCSRRSHRGGFVPLGIFVRPSSSLVGLLAGDEQGVRGAPACRLDVGSYLSLGVVVLVVVALLFQIV
jgi:hypothetical protein